MTKNRRDSGVLGRCLWVGLGLWCWASVAWGASGTVLFVQGVQSSDARASVWLEGLWHQQLLATVRSSEAVMAAIPSRKQKALSRVPGLFKAGKGHFQNLRPDQAFRAFRKAIRLLEISIPYVRDFESFAQLWAYVGVSYLLNGKRAEGLRAFRRALLLKPQLSVLDIAKDQDRRKLFEQVRSRLKSAPTGSLTVRSQPVGAVYINGRYVGLSPVKVPMPKGTHIVVVRRAGYASWGKLVALSGSDPFSLSASLSPRAARATWLQNGQAAVVHSLRRKGALPKEVRDFASYAKAQKLLLVRLRKHGKSLAIQAALYDVASGKQKAAGGAIVPWKPNATSKALALSLLQSLRQGRSVALEGWTPTSLSSLTGKSNTPKKGKGGNVGLWVGLGITGVLLIGGGVTFLVLYLTQPQLFFFCPDNGGCIKLVIK